MRWRRGFITVTACIASLSICSLVNAKTIDSGIIRIAYNNMVDYPHYMGLEWAAEKIKEESDGRFTVKIYPNGTLGDQRAALELTQNNAVQMCVANATIVESYNSDFSVLSMPYLFKDSEHQKEAYTSGILEDLFNSTQEYDFTIVGAFGSGSRNIFCDKEVREPDDLKGLKIRVMQSDNMVKMLSLMGGTGVPMSAAEQYSAMQQGVVDGAESNEIDYVGKKYYEVAPIFSRTEHCFSTDFVVASTKFMDSLSEEDRTMIKDIMSEAVKQEFEYWNTMVEESIKTAEEMGIQFVDDVNKEVFAESFKDFQATVANKNEMTQNVYDAIVGLREGSEDN